MLTDGDHAWNGRIFADTYLKMLWLLGPGIHTTAQEAMAMAMAIAHIEGTQFYSDALALCA